MFKRNRYLLYAIALMQGMVFYAPVATLYRQSAGLGIFQITLIESVSLALTIALEIPWGWAAERIGYRRTFVFCCGIYFVSKLVFWKAESFGGFLLERVLLSMNAVLHDGLGIFLNLVFGYAAQIHLNGAFCIGAGMCLLGWGLFRKYCKCLST